MASGQQGGKLDEKAGFMSHMWKKSRLPPCVLFADAVSCRMSGNRPDKIIKEERKQWNVSST
jgi:hypothetical protein